MPLSNEIEHEAYCIAEEIADVIFPDRDEHRDDLRNRLKSRLEKFAEAIINEAKL
jgi:hypothetical protein